MLSLRVLILPQPLLILPTPLPVTLTPLLPLRRSLPLPLAPAKHEVWPLHLWRYMPHVGGRYCQLLLVQRLGRDKVRVTGRGGVLNWVVGYNGWVVIRLGLRVEGGS